MIRPFLSRRPKVHPTAFVHPSAEVIGRIVLEKDSSIWPCAVLRGDIEPITLGAGSNIQDGALVHTDEKFPTVVGRSVVVGHGVILHGCRIEDGCLIGMGSIVLTGAKIGRESLVAAGALVKEGQRVPPRSLVVGVPGRVIRKLKPQEIRAIKIGAKRYVQRAKDHKDSLAFG